MGEKGFQGWGKCSSQPGQWQWWGSYQDGVQSGRVIDSVPRLPYFCTNLDLAESLSSLTVEASKGNKPTCQGARFLLSPAPYVHNSHPWVCMSIAWTCWENMWAFGVTKSWPHRGFFFNTAILLNLWDFQTSTESILITFIPQSSSYLLPGRLQHLSTICLCDPLSASLSSLHKAVVGIKWRKMQEVFSPVPALCLLNKHYALFR